MNRSTYRYDPFMDAWRIVAPSRAGVPESVTIAPQRPDPPGPCPFCPGGPRDDEPVLFAWPSLDEAEVRVIDNRFPLVESVVEEPTIAGGHARPATGWHEVLIEGAQHDADIADFTIELFRAVLRGLRERARELERRPGVRQVYLFRNRGRAAGSSQPHPHSQIVATTVVGMAQQRRTTLARAHHRREGRSLLDSRIVLELADGERIVHDGPDAVVVCPFAPRFNYETWVVPKDPAPFTTMRDVSLDAFADVLHDAVSRVVATSGRESYNLMWQLPPVGTSTEPWASWHVEIAPRGGVEAGLEALSGISMVTVTPEDAALRLRERAR